MKKRAGLFILVFVLLQTLVFAQTGATISSEQNYEMKQDVLVFFSVLGAILLTIYTIITNKRVSKRKRHNSSKK